MDDDQIDDLKMSRAKKSRISVNSSVDSEDIETLPNIRLNQIINTHLIPNKAQMKIETIVENQYPNNDSIAVWLQTPSDSTEEFVVVSAKDDDVFMRLRNELPNSVDVKINTEDEKYEGNIEVYVKQSD